MSTPGPGPVFADVLADAHAGYHDDTRRHAPPDVLVDDVVTYRMLSPHLMRAGLFVAVPTVLLLIWLLLGYLASMSSPSSAASTITSLVGFVTVVLYAAGVGAFFAPAKEPIAEYSRLLEGRADAAATAYDWVRRSAEARRAPAEVRPSTVSGVPVLVFAQRAERAMLLVQPYGEDLYVGWTMWRSRSSATMLVHFLRDTFGRFASGPRFSSELRAASTRALRESVHSLTREGLAAALHAAGHPEAGPGEHRAPRAAHRPAQPPDARPHAPRSYRDARADDERRWADDQVRAGTWGASVDPGQHAADRDAGRGTATHPDAVREDTGWGGGGRGEALPPASPHPANAWTTAPPRDEELYMPRRRGGDVDAGWGPPPRS